jgi:hypothetical protein
MKFLSSFRSRSNARQRRGHIERRLFCRPDQFSRSSYADDNSCLISEWPAFCILHDVFASRHLHITMLRNDYTMPTRCRHRGGVVDPLGCTACRTIRQPISPSNQILDHSIQNHPKPVSFLSSGVSSGSSLTLLNPTITHTQSPHLASICPSYTLLTCAEPNPQRPLSRTQTW